MEEDGRVPMSHYAVNELTFRGGCYFKYAGVAVTCGLLFGLLLFVEGNYKALGYLWIGVLIAIILNMVIVARSWKAVRLQILENNVKDYNAMLDFKLALNKLQSLKVTEHELVEPALFGSREPFRVEHFASDSLRGDLHGTIVLQGWLVLNGALVANFKGESTPSLLDLSSILFLQGESDTLRVIIPNAKVTKLMFAGTVERWLERQPGFTHVHKALREFEISDDSLVAPISNPQVLDALDASCQKPLGTRPRVVVYGEQLQPGVALATALEIDGQRQVFLPSGFFRELANTASQYLVGVEATRSLAAVQS